MSFYRFRAGFRHAFAWCPFIKVSEEDKMELQYTHTFRVTVTRSSRSVDSYTHGSRKTNNANSEKVACLQRKKNLCSSQNYHVVRKQEDTGGLWRSALWARKLLFTISRNECDWKIMKVLLILFMVLVRCALTSKDACKSNHTPCFTFVLHEYHNFYSNLIKFSIID